MFDLRLAADAGRVIEMRLVRLAWGGSAAVAEAGVMVAEKVCAAAEAAHVVMLGGTLDQVADVYRRRVSANLRWLEEGN